MTDTLAAVVRADPEWHLLPEAMAPSLRVFMQRCLEKDAKHRVGDVHDVRLALEGAFETTASTSVAPVHAPQLQVWQRPVVVVGLVAITALAASIMMRPDPIPAPDLVQFAIVPPDTAPLGIAPTNRDIAISADGTQVVYSSVNSEVGRQLYLRRIDQLDGVLLRGAEGGIAPFISPDGQWVGFAATGGLALQKVSIFGGPPVMLTESLVAVRGASWGTDDQIIFGQILGGLMRVSGGGGEPEPLTTMDTEQGETAHSWPSIIPGRDAVVFVTSTGTPLTTGQLAVLDLSTGDVTRLGLAGVSPHFVSTGHLVYAAEDGSVRAAPFDASALEVTGNPVPLVENVMVKNSGAANFSVSDTGSLAYVPGRRGSSDRTLALVGRDGTVEPLNVPLAPYLSPRLSPDGATLVVQTSEDDGGVLWLYDLGGDAQIQQLTFDGDNHRAVWTPDGQRITFSSDRDGTMSLYSMPADGSGAAERLTTADEGTLHWPGSWAPDGETLLFHVQRAIATDWDIWSLSANGRETQSLYDTPDTIYMGAELSPNGQWLAYGSGLNAVDIDIYVEPFPPTGSKRRISQNGGSWPLWSPDGDRLFYRSIRSIATSAAITLRSVDVVTEPDFAFRNEQTLPTDGFTVGALYRDYDITPDGERLIMVFPADQTGDASPPQINMILNWFQELTGRVPIP